MKFINTGIILAALTFGAASGQNNTPTTSESLFSILETSEITKEALNLNNRMFNLLNVVLASNAANLGESDCKGVKEAITENFNDIIEFSDSIEAKILPDEEGYAEKSDAFHSVSRLMAAIVNMKYSVDYACSSGPRELVRLHAELAETNMYLARLIIGKAGK